MIKRINPSPVKGKLDAPSSKSYMQRAIAIALLAEGKSTIYKPSLCDDATSAVSMARKLGANISINPSEVIINGVKQLNGGNLSAGESGLGIRMFASIASLSKKKIKITGEGSLIKRPISMMEEPLKSLGVNLKTNNGFLPLELQGPLKGGAINVDGRISSQVLTGLLIALPLAENDSVIEVENLQSKPYIDMTLEITKHFGVQIENQDYSRFIIKGKQKYQACNYTIEGDWSSAAFHLVAGAIGGRVELTGLNMNSKQADRKIIDALKLAGADIKVKNSDNLNCSTIQICKNSLNAIDFDATHCPDLFPPLIVLCACCSGRSKIKGVFRLKHKESDRAFVLKTEMAKIGIHISIDEDNIYIDGGQIRGGKIHSHNDHRIAMAGAIAGLVSNHGIDIEGSESVNKSYPEFFNDLQQLTNHYE